jgi:hypothetical protein
LVFEVSMLLRVLLAGVLGGIAMFMWGFVAHTVLPLYNDVSKVAVKEDAMLDSLKSYLKEPGLYMVPGMDMSKTMTEEEKAAFTKKWQTEGHALICYSAPTGEDPISVKTLAPQFLACVITAFLLALVLWKGAGDASFLAKIWMSTLIGVIASVAIDGSFVIWHGFPQGYLVASILDHAASFFLAGAVAAFVMRPAKTS